MAKRTRRNADAGDSADRHLNGGDPLSENVRAGLAEDGITVHDVPLNSPARGEIIREAWNTIDDFERQIDALKAEIKAVIETRIVAGLGMKKRHFAHIRKLYQIKGDQRDILFDAMRECFAALGSGEQLDWLSVAEGAGEQRAPADDAAF